MDWLPRNLLGGRPRYMAIVEAVALDVQTGALAPGTRLPTQRDLAKRLGVTVRTVGRAYALAAEKGLLSGEIGRGTFVRGSAAKASSAEAGTQILDLSQNTPTAGPYGAALGKALQAITAERGLDWMMEYAPYYGHHSHRAAGAAWLSQVGVEVTADQVLMTAGAQQGMYAALAALRDRGAIMTEALTYSIAADAMRSLGLRPLPVEMDENGMKPDSLERIAAETGARAALLVPTLHNPTAVLMPEQRRREIAEVARRNDIVLVEDDVYGFLLPKRPPPIATLAPDHTIYLASASKCLGPGLRVGWLVAHPRLLERCAAAAIPMTLSQPQLTSEVVRRWIKDGTAQELLEWQRQEGARRYEIASGALDGLDWHGHSGGFHIFLKVPPPWTSEMFAASAEARCRVRVVPANLFSLTGAAPAAVRLSISAAPSHAALAECLSAVAHLARSTPAARYPVI